MRIRRGKILLDALQIKSIDKARKLAKALEVIEEECGIHSVEIEMNDIFICPWINLDILDDTPMENLLQGLLKELRETE